MFCCCTIPIRGSLWSDGSSFKHGAVWSGQTFMFRRNWDTLPVIRTFSAKTVGQWPGCSRSRISVIYWFLNYRVSKHRAQFWKAKLPLHLQSSSVAALFSGNVIGSTSQQNIMIFSGRILWLHDGKSDRFENHKQKVNMILKREKTLAARHVPGKIVIFFSFFLGNIVVIKMLGLCNTFYYI